MLFKEVTSVLGIMTIGYGIGKLIEFIIYKKKEKNKNEKKK